MYHLSQFPKLYGLTRFGGFGMSGHGKGVPDGLGPAMKHMLYNGWLAKIVSLTQPNVSSTFGII